ncbi:MAG: hypothetical protein HUJ58_08680, partial [Erysipelotrichaceae bacterium]|nr:hypothetical protein [Erysipelotrichaceae bacterium]
VYYVFPEGGIGNTSESTTDKYSYGVRPVITLKANLDIVSGNGLVDNPYRIVDDIKDNEKTYYLNEMPVGTYFLYSEDVYRVIGQEDGKVKAIMMDVLHKDDGSVYTRKFSSDTCKFTLDEGNIGYYLNNTWLNKQDHPEYLAKGTFCTGPYTYNGKYTQAKLNSVTVKAKVGLPQIGDLFNVNNLTEGEEEIVYWTCNYKKNAEQLVWVSRDKDWLFGDFSYNKYAVRPVIYLKSNIIITTGDGTADFPYQIAEGETK